MNRLPPGGHLHALDGFEGRACGVVRGKGPVHGLTHTPGRIDACPAAFVRETNIMGVREPVLEAGHLRPLPVGQVQDVGLDDQVRCRLLCRVFLLVILRGLQHNLFPNSGPGDHAGGQHQKVRLDLDVLSQKGVVHLDPQALVAVLLHRGHFALGEKDPLVLLHLLVIVLVLARGADVLVDDVDLGFRIRLPDVLGLFERGHAANRGAVRQMVRVP